MRSSTIHSTQMKKWLQLYFIAGSSDCAMEPLHVLEEAIQGGISIYQFREKGSQAFSGDKKLELASRLQHVCKRHGVPFIVNDDIELAIQLDADGVHVGQDDEPLSVVRQKLGDGKIIGVSAHNLVEAEKAINGGADYLGVGPIFPTQSKLDASPVQGPSILKRMRSQYPDFPMVGIGGITPENAQLVMEAGANGVCVISAISRAELVMERARQLSRVVQRYTT